MNHNKREGNRFEQEFAEVLGKLGYWAHVMQQNKAGQPADIVVAKLQYATLIDCKVISTDKGFPISRIEENQKLAMGKFSKITARSCWFAFKLPDGLIRLLKSSEVFAYYRDNDTTVIPNEWIRENGWTFDDWILLTQRMST